MPLFYLQTRGIPQKRAEAIMVYAFAAEVLERISNTTLRARLEELLYEKLAVESQA
jgi:Fe-S cluster assembly protein SufD